ncbi:hypothetical protein A2706_01660 [Candidatus Peribacteria bacterium RIFCSPHIGHO2_01_FULL_51_35]|nr:MAG: hypothetical protein A2706_01660 [Candidatus Peribacteria bacterium RIFCSPHIGHO2_01_FULL_51_35]
MDLELQLRLKSETGAIMRHAEDLSELCGMGMQEALTKIHDGVAAMLKQDSAREYVGKTPLTVELAALRVISEARAKKNQAEETTPPLPAFSNGHVRDPKAGSPRFRSLDRD